MKIISIYVSAFLSIFFAVPVFGQTQSELAKGAARTRTNPNFIRVCSQLNGMTVSQAVEFLNKSPYHHTLKQCPVGGFTTGGIGGDSKILPVPSVAPWGNYRVAPGSLVAPPQPPGGRIYPRSPRGPFIGR
jgi:hypothetical protein